MLKNYLKTAFKVFLRRKFFTFVSLFGIALTLLVLLVATAFLDHVLAARAPETRLDRTLGIFHLEMRGPNGRWLGEPGYLFLSRYVLDMDELPEVAAVSAFSEETKVASYPEGGKVELRLRRTDGIYWQILDFEFLDGGPFTQDDEVRANPVAVINEDTRERLFGDGPAVGRTMTVSGQRFRVVGVVADVSTLRSMSSGDVWVPISSARSQAYRREIMGGFYAMILARDRADFPAIKAECRRRLSEAEPPDPKNYETFLGSADTYFESLARDLFGDPDSDHVVWYLRVVIGILMVLFMVLPSVNLINLNVSRILERSSEIGVRKAFGASTRTLIGQFVVENVLLTLVGGGVALVLAVFVLAALSDNTFLPHAVFAINFRIFAWGFVITLFFGLLSGIYPAWRMSRLQPVVALRGRFS